MSDYTPRPASDYAPSTEEVRRVVMSLNNYLDEPRAAELDGELFDLWLAEVKAQERERIVKLIEPEYNRGWVTAASFVRHLVALIKGEEQ